jgi:hypothetical protein
MNMIAACRKIIFILAFAIPCSAGADWLYFISWKTNQLQRVDTATFELEVIGELGFDYRRGGIAWDPEAGKFFVIADPSSQIENPKLYLVDPFTANWELIGTIDLKADLSGTQPYGLEYIAETEQLLLSYQSTVVSINLSTLSVSEIADSDSGNNQFGGLAYDTATKRLYTTDSDGSSHRVKSSDRSISSDCVSTEFFEGGFAYDPVNDVFWQLNLDGTTNEVWTRTMAPGCVNSFREGDLGPWADSLAFVVNEDLGFGITTAFNDAWYNPLTDGQGFMIAVLPNQKLVFLTWFTFDVERPPEDVTAMLGEPGHRWLTAQGPYEGDTANLTIYVTSGGVFDSPNPPATTDPEGDGTIKLQFADCENGLLEYEITSLGLSGTIPIERVALDNVSSCEQSTLSK